MALPALGALRRQRGPLAGTFITCGSADTIELACHAGFDAVILDGQHGSFDLAGLREGVRAAEAAGAYPIARLPAVGRDWIEPLLDAGFPCLLAPMVNTVEQAAELVRASHYPPLGQRSQSGCRASLRHAPDYRDCFNNTFALLLMVEHAAAVAIVDDLVRLPGVAGIFIGPTDLASSLVAEPDPAAAVSAAIATVRDRVRRAGKLLGVATGSVAAAQRYRDEGFDLVTIATDRRLLLEAFTVAVAGWAAPS